MRDVLKKPSLRLALVVYVVVPLVLAIGAVSYFALRTFERSIEDRMEEEVELVARALQRPLSQALEHGRPGSVDEALSSVFSIHRVYGAYVYDSEGTLISSAGQHALPDRGKLSVLAETGTRQGGYDRLSGRNMYSYFVPLVRTGERNNGLLQVTRRASDIEEAVGRLRRAAAGVILAALMLMTGLVLYGHHGAIGRHLGRLGTSMRRVRQGDRDHRAPEDGPAEVAALGQGLNAMLDSITRAEGEIRERRAAQASLEQRLRHAEKLAAIGQLAAGVAHELGTPLSVVDGKAQRALRKKLPAPVHATLQDVRGEVRRMERIVRQLLDFGRRHAAHRRPVAADRLARMAVSSLQEARSPEETTVELDGPSPAPTLSVDPALVERALLNLLRNALEAAPAGRVRLAWFADDEAAGFTVEDDGPGIPSEARPRLFEPFFTTKDVGEGTGLGLAVVHGIVEEHGGQITVEESALGGARFRVCLPRAVSEQQVASEQQVVA